jgi:hypothetical protein
VIGANAAPDAHLIIDAGDIVDQLDGLHRAHIDTHLASVAQFLVNCGPIRSVGLHRGRSTIVELKGAAAALAAVADGKLVHFYVVFLVKELVNQARFFALLQYPFGFFF